MPGNEYNLEEIVQKIKGDLGNQVKIYRDSRVPNKFYADERGHFGPSGHAYGGDLADIIGMIAPKVVVPLHGNSLRREALADIASEQGAAAIVMGDNDTFSF